MLTTGQAILLFLSLTLAIGGKSEVTGNIFLIGKILNVSIYIFGHFILPERIQPFEEQFPFPSL